jgi:type IV secretion system protein VirB3
MSQTLNINPIFGALTRPAMVGGVSLDYYIINLSLSVVSFIVLGSLLYGLIFIPIHFFGVLVCRYDNQFFSVASKAFFMPAIPNKSVWGVRAYEPY